jgi:hypothetical protein
MTGTSAGDLAAALSVLDVSASKYGSYILRLGKKPDLPASDGKFTLGGLSGLNSYPNVKVAQLTIEGTVPIRLPEVADLWVRNNNTVIYGVNITVRPEWTTFVYNSGSGNVTVNLKDDAGWAGATPTARLALLSNFDTRDSLLTFNSVSYTKKFFRSIDWGRDVLGVTALGDYFLVAFEGLTEIDLSHLAGVASIGGAFLHSCIRLTEIDLSPLAGVADIDHGFLAYCNGLTELDMTPLAGINSIENNIFACCRLLTSVDMRGIGYDKIYPGAAFNIGLDTTGCTVRVSEDPALWAARFTSRFALVTFVN